MEKEGIQSAIDFIKYIMAISGGAIAFAVQPAFYQTSLLVKILASFAVFLLSISIISGILAHSSGSLKLSRGNYDPDDPYFRFPGLVMLVSFGIGFIFMIVSVAIKVWGNVV